MNLSSTHVNPTKLTATEVGNIIPDLRVGDKDLENAFSLNPANLMRAAAPWPGETHFRRTGRQKSFVSCVSQEGHSKARVNTLNLNLHWCNMLACQGAGQDSIRVSIWDLRSRADGTAAVAGGGDTPVRDA